MTTLSVTPDQLIQHGLNDREEAEKFAQKINLILQKNAPEAAWKIISRTTLSSYPFQLHLFLFSLIYPEWHDKPELAPAWFPDPKEIKTNHLWQWMQALKFESISDFHRWTCDHEEIFWETLLKNLGIIFKEPPKKIVDLSNGIESPHWLPGAKLNIIDSCFTADPSATAIIFQDEKNILQKKSFHELNKFSNQIANSLVAADYKTGDAIAIIMPMTPEAIALYLGIIKMGGVVVSIADSFSAEEIATRLQIANTQLVFTQDFILRDNKKIPLYEKIIAANSPKTVVLSSEKKISLRQQDWVWENFLVDKKTFQSIALDPMSPCNILFSSGTTGEPKAIPWNHTTAIKAAGDAYLHHNIQPNDVLAWPTNLGWMMGPWLIYAALINRAAIAVYSDVPKDRAFGKFIQDSKTTMLGVVPTLVASWRQSHCMEGLNWNSIKTFSSTGECSNAEDMLYLMSLANYKPVIEYCGGTEIGGAYISSTLIEKNYPALFTTPAMGLDFVLLDETGHSTNIGEVGLIPPSIGLSTQLLNANHHQIYFANMPLSADGKKLRRHGDQIKRFENGYYCMLGRADDTMNLGGIKISSAEIERVIAGLPSIKETAAIAVTKKSGGPSQLVIYAATDESLDKENIKTVLQKKINQSLNPLFRIQDVVFVKELPKTASNKIMRRVLRQQYQE